MLDVMELQICKMAFFLDLQNRCLTIADGARYVLWTDNIRCVDQLHLCTQICESTDLRYVKANLYRAQFAVETVKDAS
ncbi:hypothetical protein MPTK1_8g18060 [Marchantia polymorpha subsp. ruderalis]|uniref:Uncharacterized protein n=1 Tax=Marchantia polymorpha TaxID=3197 RepID=A0A2R6X8J1_MARPO|nr:hypothetical protein MARPO_0030s0139 [Marchantia polymorpha]BBN20302.1 hypothetical protein Mp_8g18060 [Marchantia polymorpha subsp. ruderalis]|eukprot:PTQ42422.1 hypothetical protein MARPO_0030s0139 [Marchantia polymorpha]